MSSSPLPDTLVFAAAMAGPLPDRLVFDAAAKDTVPTVLAFPPVSDLPPPSRRWLEENAPADEFGDGLAGDSGDAGDTPDYDSDMGDDGADGFADEDFPVDALPDYD